MVTTRYRRRLPHIHISGHNYFLTFCLSSGQMTTLSPDERTLVEAHIRRMSPGTVQAFVVMPDHVHLLYQSDPGEVLSKTVQALKGVSSHALVKRHGRNAPVWQDETFDHLIRDEEELRETWLYVEGNPVRKGLARRDDAYPWSSASVRCAGEAPAPQADDSVGQASRLPCERIKR